MYQLVVSDLDGTLLTPDHVIGGYTKSILEQWVEKGCHFVFASGRHHLDVFGIREYLGLPAYVISANGARVHDPDGNLVLGHDVPGDIIERVLAKVWDDKSLTVHLFQDTGWLSSRKNEDIEKYHRISGFGYSLFHHATLKSENIAKLSLTHPDHQYLVQYEQILSPMLEGVANVMFSSPFCLEVTAPKATKGDALEVVTAKLGIAREQTLAFGDAMNDKEMLEYAGKGLIMATAQERLKQCLHRHEVIGSCADEAVANYIAAYL
ncbi:Cof-type HAD-IIB family hydrolase [Photobacterium sanctipauli]|uniref:Cof-type HAD-IIB family hydrolase n=1 Tax=Photobacterium sanctipauli TaxID=1342794 RepID=A0A2T3P0Y1_9GAMM|nr:Cof-type HAD-IIB family hydrolase [Photobacterium sanctipauli]PSW22160.1 Cof-type HAD-IIB family hydrolase [Photobacterium sanctipauli]